MSTKPRVGVDITARDLTAVAFGQAQKRMAAFGQSVGSIGTAFRALAGSAALLAVGNGLKNAVDRMDEMGKAAQRMGVSVQSISRLSLAANLAGVSMEGLGTAFGTLNRNIAAIAGGDTKSDPARALAALGISVRDATGNIKSADQVLAEMADRFSRMQDGAGKSALALTLMGRGSAEMIPLLNGGAASLRELGDEAARTGQQLSEEAARNAGVLNDNVGRLWGRVDGFANLLAQKLIPDLIDWSDRLLGVADSASIAGQAMGEWDRLKQSASAFVDTTRGEWEGLKALAIGMGEAFSNDAIWGNKTAGILADAWSNAGARIRDAATDVEALRQSVERLNKGSLPDTISGTGVLTPKTKPPTAWAGSEAALAAEREHNKLLAEAKRLYEGSRTAAQEYADTIARLDLLKSKGLLTLEQYNTALFKARWEFTQSKVSAAEAVQSFFDFGDSLKSSFSTAFASIVDGTKSVSGAFQDMTRSLLASATNAFANRAFSLLLDSLMGGHPLYGGGVGSGFGSILGSLFGGARAAGGPVQPGRAYLVGERGPELFSPGSSGSIVPRVGVGGGVKVVINDMRQNAPAVEQRQDRQGNIELFIRDQVNSIIQSGQADRALASRHGLQPAMRR